ncbi:MAG: molybdopterin-dependent oxidoreductase, partial [Coriobacteriales bacterium]|nr:molybdopterin-dependent oxidoreductase [Coriobacteriales bacterium]
ISISEAKITPPGEAKSDLQILAGLAERLGFGDKFNQAPSVYIDCVLKPYGFDYNHLKQVKAVDTRDFDWIPYRDGVFPTKSSKAELFVSSWQAAGFPAIPEYRRTQESILNASTYPLAAVQRKTYRSVHTTFNQLETTQRLFGNMPCITINSADAQARDIKSGDLVTAFNDRGVHHGVAQVTPHVKQGVVVLENGWQDNFGGSSSSAVTNNAFPTLGTTHACNSTLVEIRKGE